jgi:hypothetical protein
VNGGFLLQTCDFVLHQQLATLQLYDLEIVDGRMRAGFADFRFQGPVPSFKFRKMRLYGHVLGFSSASELQLKYTSFRDDFEAGFIVRRSKRRPILPLEWPQLEPKQAKRDNLASLRRWR